MPTMRAAVIAFLALAASLAWAAETYKVGDEVADVTLTMADGKDAKLSSHEGNVVVLLFYGTWTRRAAEDAKQVDAIRKARPKQKLTVIGVARDVKAADAKKFGEDHKLGFAQAADPKSELYGRFATKGVPWVAVLDAKRKLKYSAAGIDEDAIDTALTELLGAKPPAEGGGKKK